MVETESYLYSLNSKTGWLCLEFANTVEWRATDHPEDHINNYDELVSWARQVRVITEPESQDLLRKATRHPETSRATYKRAISLREAIYRIFSAVVADKQPEIDDLDSFNASLSDAFVHLRIANIEKRFTWEWATDVHAIDHMLWPVVRSAGSLLTSKEFDRLGECADDLGCRSLFYDISRNKSRRWCDMKSCGNRNKARQFYKRKIKSRKK